MMIQFLLVSKLVYNLKKNSARILQTPTKEANPGQGMNPAVEVVVVVAEEEKGEGGEKVEEIQKDMSTGKWRKRPRRRSGRGRRRGRRRRTGWWR